MLCYRPGKLNNHLEAAIHEAMSELDKMSGTVSIYTCLDESSPSSPPTCPAATMMFLSVCPPSDPIEGSSGEAPQAQEEEDIQITLNVSAQERPQSLSETSSGGLRCDLSSLTGATHGLSVVHRCSMISTWLHDWTQKVLETPITNTVLTVEKKKKK